ncbi:hypothetical protein DP149_07720 [Clostridium tetani]|uniref:Uncharacterized protein n=1 Tax=Clostridium tetani (strain Massachusetts / E88) TaxID=212717 RepID=Q897G0_CLOTE|nr:hypothetical protein [Clostridium tetani]AAO35376.1 hypothetical protein CTC_00778 [Clostridium tetani E88]KGI40619.1 hypothetical protein LA33_08265 [Clostridium tetani ATCC 9441]KGI41353.1 hypothetical protein KY52_00050 [Clostridium tetani]KGI46428.1 hypothetical protein KY54_00050 [Clostridium tetani]KHO36680.1 hypothetical protein OR63_03650 [Clostridium tetani]
MYKKRQYKNFICIIIVLLMVLAIGDTGVLGMRKVFAKTNKDSNVIKVEGDLEDNIITLDEIQSMDIRSIVNKIQIENIGISSIRVVNDLKGIKAGDEIEFEVQDELGGEIPKDNLVFTINNEELGKMDENITNKFIKLGSDTVTVKVTLKDRPNIKDEVRF